MFKDNKYTKWYYKLINNRKQKQDEISNGYFERHHIIPKSMGGSNQFHNIIKLTAREHFICHLLLTKMTDKNGMKTALIRMINKDMDHKKYYIPKSSKIYEYARKQASEAKKGKNNPMYGKRFTVSDEKKRRMSIAMKNCEALKRIRASKEFKQKISDAQIEEVCLVSAIDYSIKATYRNCTHMAKALGCTRANLTNARRDKRLIGKKLKSVEGKCYVVYKKDIPDFILTFNS